MKRTELNKGKVEGLLENYMDRFKNIKVVKTKPTLFDVEPKMSLAYEDIPRCPYCTRRLKINLKQTLARCGRPDCICPNRGGFIIRMSKLTK